MKNEKRRDSKGRTLKTGESQRADGRYQYQYTDHDKKRHIVYSWRLLPSDSCTSDKKGEKSLREKEKDIEKALIQGRNVQSGNISLNDMFDIYLSKKRNHGKPLNQNTLNNYKSMYNKHIRISSVGEMKIGDIRKLHIVDLYQELKNRGLAYGTVVFYNKVLSSVFNMAIDNNYIDRNPTARALDEVEGETQSREALTENQQKVFLDFMEQYDADLYRKLIFLVDTMCRISEFAGVTWDNINMKDKMIVIDHQLQYKKYPGDKKATYHVTKTKGREIRYIPMTNRLYNILKDMKKYYFITNKKITIDGISNFVFYTKRGKLMDGSEFRRRLNQALAAYNEISESKIEYLVPHMLRHSGATRNAESGMDIKVLQYLMGHKSSKTTNDIYNHVSKERAVKEVLKVAKIQAKQA